MNIIEYKGYPIGYLLNHYTTNVIKNLGTYIVHLEDGMFIFNTLKAAQKHIDNLLFDKKLENIIE